MKSIILKIKSRLLLCGILALSATGAVAQNYMPVDAGSDVQFKIVNHLIISSTVTGHFKGLKGKIVFEPNAPQKSSFDVTVNVKTISTGIGKRDKDLQEEKYFNADKYPLIRIRSTKISGGKDANYIFTGQLTIKGITKSVSFPFKEVPKNGGYLFKGQFNMNRLDYHVGPDKTIDKELTVSLSVFAKKQ